MKRALYKFSVIITLIIMSRETRKPAEFNLYVYGKYIFLFYHFVPIV